MLSVLVVGRYDDFPARWDTTASLHLVLFDYAQRKSRKLMIWICDFPHTPARQIYRDQIPRAQRRLAQTDQLVRTTRLAVGKRGVSRIEAPELARSRRPLVDGGGNLCPTFRSEDRRGGKEGGSTCRARWWAYH